jgi:dihydropteroate synthase
VEKGAAIIDFGAESSRPGAEYISLDQELDRLIPVIEGFRRRSQAAVSVDTRKAGAARRALEAGADMINDISALEDDPDMGRVCGEHGAFVVLMHKRGIPRNMQDHPRYDDTVREVRDYLIAAAAGAEAAGIRRDRIILDPGIGFGKTLEDNLAILNRLAEIRSSGYPLLVGLSRKSLIGGLTGRSVEERLSGTLAAEAFCVLAGADILRVHDVGETLDLVKVLRGIQNAGT